MIVLKINCSKIPKERLFQGKNGKMIDLVLMENRDGPDQYGNDGFVSVSLSKEERASGARGEIVGNWKELGKRQDGTATKRTAPPAARPKPVDPDLDGAEQVDIPF